MLTHQRAIDTADAIADLSNEASKLLARINQALAFNSHLSIAWTPATKTFTAVNATDVCTSNAHGLLNGQKARLTNAGGALPAGLLPDTDYFLIAVAANTWQLSLTLGGAAVNFTTDGTGTHTLHPVPSYLTEEANGNLSGRLYTRQEVSNAIFSLEQLQRVLTNQTITQGDHLGNLNKLARPLG